MHLARRTLAIAAIVLTAILCLVLAFATDKDMAEFFSYVDTHSGSAIVVLTFVLVLVTGFYAIMTYAMVDEMRKTREGQYRPTIVVDLIDHQERHLTYFVVQNMGTLTAR